MRSLPPISLEVSHSSAYTILKHRISEGHLAIHHVPDKCKPSDFLTKSGISREKFDTSLAYASGIPA